MRISKWGNSLAIRLPAAVVEALHLKEGDQVEVHVAGDRRFQIRRDSTRQKALDQLRKLSRELPPGFTFDRETANER